MSSSGASAGGSLRVICGPTAAGKSALVAALAARTPITVVSADSRQIYRGFDVGTAKPTPPERLAVPHRGIDLIEPMERYSAAAWAGGAAEWVAEAVREERAPVLVGGTGFYLRALIEPLFAEPPLDAVRRAALAVELAALPTAKLRERCERLDPARAHLGRAQLLRAIEVAALTGEPLSTWYARHPAAAPRPVRYLVVDPGEVLLDWIEGRVHRMLADGWEAEVLALMRTVPDLAPAWNATGYEAIRELVRGTLERRAAIARIAIATRQYAKRQRTWFRHQLANGPVVRLDPRLPHALERAWAWWQGNDSGGTA